MPDFTQLTRIVYRAESTASMKELAGFVKGQSMPSYSSKSAAEEFVGRIAAADIRADIDKTYQALRDAYGFKRKQIEASIDGGVGVIRTARFVYSIHLTVDPDDPRKVLQRREIGSLSDPLIVQTLEFQAVFGTLFNSLVFEFATPILVAELVDQFEEEDRPGVKVTCASDESWCEIVLKGFRGAIRIDAKSLTISGRHSPSAASLLDQFLAFVAQLPRGKSRPAIE